jgi:glycosyltransferase involved in cell wall biosynthesis
MNVYVPTETKFWKQEDNAIFPCHPVHTARFWSRYLDVFDEVILSGRLVPTPPCADTSKPTTNENIQFYPIVNADTTRRAIQAIFRLWQRIDRDKNAAICLRMPTLTSSIIGLLASAKGRPFGVEVVGDPADALSISVAKAVHHRLLLRFFLVFAQKLLCRRACATAYVTEKCLQRRYPPRAGAYSTHFSSIEMTDEFFQEVAEQPEQVYRIVHVGSMGQALYKGQDILLRAFLSLLPKYPELKLTLNGGGSSLQIIKHMVTELGLGNHVDVTGHLNDPKLLQNILDESHLFVFPSIQEGLPKALIEAMARGLPAIASRVGGNEELVGEYALVPSGDIEQLAAKMDAFISSKALREKAAQENYTKAREYHIDNIRPRRIAYYRAIRAKTEEWQRRNGYV